MADQELHETNAQGDDAVAQTTVEATENMDTTTDIAGEVTTDSAAETQVAEENTEVDAEETAASGNTETTAYVADAESQDTDETAETENEVDTKFEADGDAEVAAEDTTDTATEDEDTEDDEDDLNLPMDRINDILNATADKSALTPQMRRMMQRQAENTKRVEETIKDTKSNPRWLVPLFCILMVIGLIWAVVYYITGNYPIPGIGAWNLAIAVAFLLIGFLMTMAWH